MKMHFSKLPFMGMVILGMTLGMVVKAQDPAPDSSIQRENAVKVFIDCYYCDMILRYG